MHHFPTMLESPPLISLQTVSEQQTRSWLAWHSYRAFSPPTDSRDFEFDSINLTFNPGETYKEFQVSVADDEDNLEPDEQFMLNLVVISLRGSSPGDFENTNVTITDDKGT